MVYIDYTLVNYILLVLFCVLVFSITIYFLMYLSEISKVKKDGLYIQYVNKFLKNNKRIVTEALNQNSEAYQYLSDKSKKNKDIALLALNKNPSNFNYLPHVFRENKDFIKKALINNPLIFNHLAESTKEDIYFLEEIKEINPNLKSQIENEIYIQKEKEKKKIIESLEKNGTKYLELTSTQKTDPDIALAAVKQNSNVFGYLPEDLKKNKTLIKEIIKVHPVIYGLIKIELLKDIGFLEELYGITTEIDKDIDRRKIALEREIKGKIIAKLEEDPEGYYKLDNKYKNDKDIILTVIRKNFTIYTNISESLRKDTNVIRAYLQVNNDTNKIPKDVFSDEEKLLSLLVDFPNIYSDIDKNLKSSKEFLNRVKKLNVKSLSEMASRDLGRIFNEEKQQILKEIRRKEKTIETLSEELREDDDIIFESMNIDPKNIKYIGKGKKGNKEFLLKIINNFKVDFEDLDKESRSDIAFLEYVLNNAQSLEERNSEFKEKVENKIATLKEEKKERIIDKLMENSEYYKGLSVEYRNDKDISKLVLQYREDLYSYLGEELKKDDEYSIELIKLNNKIVKHLDLMSKSKEFIYKVSDINEDLSNQMKEVIREKERLEKEEILKEVAKDSQIYFTLEEKYKEDIDIAKTALLGDFKIYLKLSKQLKNNIDICKSMLEKDEKFLKLFPKEVNEDTFTLKKFLIDYPGVFQFINEKILMNKEFLFSIKTSNEKLLKEIREYLDLINKKEKEEKISRILSGELNFESLSEEDREDSEIAISGIKTKKSNIRYIGEKLKRSKEFFIELIKNSLIEFEDIPGNLVRDKVFLERILDEVKGNDEYHINLLGKVKEELNALIELEIEKSIKIVTIDGSKLEKLSDELKSNEKVVLAAVKNRPSSIKFAGEKLKRDAIFIGKLILENQDIVNFVNWAELNNRGFLKSIARTLKVNSREIPNKIKEYLNSSYLKEIEEIKDKLTTKELKFQNLKNELRDNFEIAMVAVSIDPNNLAFIGDSLKRSKKFTREIMVRHVS